MQFTYWEEGDRNYILLDGVYNIFKSGLFFFFFLRNFKVIKPSWDLPHLRQDSPFLFYFYLFVPKLLSKKLPILHLLSHFWEHCFWMQDIQEWHLSAGCADSLALLCSFSAFLSQIFQHRFMGRRVKSRLPMVRSR